MKLRTWGRKPDPRKLAADQKRRQWMIYTAIYSGAIGAMVVTAAAAFSH
ncbi:hypothetical protein [Asticcacaulis benevestitus]|uniref:Uncharacterized protein n=1 Tax=Asticcacaulis benevestitus DSM 16100 = ATCC BAA-896 TaxID=1121022 RepID=V4Q5Q1_9CAUL|nr:hypothetical protein [Asticcacaulis benevestitus]ESQ93150.1 hypothetical protein ABENE_06270 [Asticcacaulis benevestitus DSM 16100 = ATCC BAA-896]